MSGALLLLLLLLAYTGYQTFFVLPRGKAVVQASRAYTVQNYVDCIDKLKNQEPEHMDTYTKYILASSYARSEALEKEELQNVHEKLSIYSNEAELGYWIAVGHGHMLDENKVQLAVCEFIVAGTRTVNNAKNAKSGDFLGDRRVVRAEIVDSISIDE